MSINFGIITSLLIVVVFCLIKYVSKHGSRYNLDCDDCSCIAAMSIAFIIIPLGIYTGFCFLNPDKSMINLNSLVVIENSKDDSRLAELQAKYDQLLKMKINDITKAKTLKNELRQIEIVV